MNVLGFSVFFFFDVCSKVRESPEKAPLWSRWRFYTSTASTQSECCSLCIYSYITQRLKNCAIARFTTILLMRKTVAAVIQPVNVARALQRRLGPVSHAKQLISAPLCSVFPHLSVWFYSYHAWVLGSTLQHKWLINSPRLFPVSCERVKGCDRHRPIDNLFCCKALHGIDLFSGLF